MFETNYYVIAFRRRGAALVGDPPSRVKDYIAAIGEAQRLAQARAGAMVFARTRDRHGRNVEIIFRTGEVPEDVLGVV